MTSVDALVARGFANEKGLGKVIPKSWTLQQAEVFLAVVGRVANDVLRQRHRFSGEGRDDPQGRRSPITDQELPWIAWQPLGRERRRQIDAVTLEGKDFVERRTGKEFIVDPTRADFQPHPLVAEAYEASEERAS